MSPTEACREGGVCIEDLGVSYAALVHFNAVVGCTVTGGQCVSLERALAQREALLKARAEGSWPALRHAWVSILSSEEHLWMSGGASVRKPKRTLWL